MSQTEHEASSIDGVVSLDHARSRRSAALERLRSRSDVANRDVETTWFEGTTCGTLDVSLAAPVGLVFVHVSGPASDGRVLVSVARAWERGFVSACHRLLTTETLGAGSPAIAELIGDADALVVRTSGAVDLSTADLGAALEVVEHAPLHHLDFDVVEFGQALGLTRDGRLGTASVADLVAGPLDDTDLLVEAASLELMLMIAAHTVAVRVPTELVERRDEFANGLTLCS